MKLIRNARQMMVLVVAALVLLSAPAAQAFYHPHAGRWLSRDPIGERGGANVCGFVRNDLVNGVDRDGRQAPATIGGQCPNCGQIMVAYTASPHVCPAPLPAEKLGFEMCRRDALGGDCKSAIANTALGGAHSFLRRKFLNDQGESDYAGWGWNGDSPPSLEGPSIVKPKYAWMVSCAACKRTDKLLEKGEAAQEGRKGVDASDAEIWDCITQVPASKPYSPLGYNCWEWAKEAASKCGLDCPTPASLQKPPGS